MPAHLRSDPHSKRRLSDVVFFRLEGLHVGSFGQVSSSTFLASDELNLARHDR